VEIDALGDYLDQGVIVIGGDGAISYSNSCARQLLGRDTLTGEPFAALSLFRIQRLVDRVARERRTAFDGDVDLTGRSVRVDVAPIGADDVAVFLRDDTRLNHLETVRRDFVANVSHELRTPIAAISLIVETLNNGALDDPAAAHEFVERIGSEVSNLNQMVEELLALSRMESGSDEAIERDELPMTWLVNALQRLNPLLAARGQTLVTDIADGVPAIDGNARMVEQLFRNLVHNASKYSPAGTEILFIARKVPEGVEIKVIDQGVGIAPEDLPRVFERFWKADRSRQRDGEGNGLGLAIAKHAVEAHGGTIKVESQPQHGATFTVVMPAVGVGTVPA
jgi:two-component system phosphate regulon sensor histidine kinase PhoR